MWRVLTLLWIAGCNDDYVLDAGEGGSTDRIDTILALTGDASSGETLFNAGCDTCHDPAGLEDRVGPALAAYVAASTDEVLVDIMLNGQGAMPGQPLEDQEAADILAWLLATWGTPVAPDGEGLFTDSCAVCHNRDGSSGGGKPGPGLATVVPNRTRAQLITTVTDGVYPGMPGQGGVLTTEEIGVLVDWLITTFPSP